MKTLGEKLFNADTMQRIFKLVFWREHRPLVFVVGRGIGGTIPGHTFHRNLGHLVGVQ
ncbi:hypothetical protein SERLA73DRAFT_137970, partial [Serpula lacrymans var. lacrymans S7.3]